MLLKNKNIAEYLDGPSLYGRLGWCDRVFMSVCIVFHETEIFHDIVYLCVIGCILV